MTSCYFSWELWASKLPVSPPALETFRCRQPFSRLKNFIHLGLPFLPKFVCVVKGKTKNWVCPQFYWKVSEGEENPNYFQATAKGWGALLRTWGQTGRGVRGLKKGFLRFLLPRLARLEQDHTLEEYFGNSSMHRDALSFLLNIQGRNSEGEWISPMPYEEHGAKPGTEPSFSRHHSRYFTVKPSFHSSAQLLDLPSVLTAPAGIWAKILLSVAWINSSFLSLNDA